MEDESGHSIFGAIEQEVSRYSRRRPHSRHAGLDPASAFRPAFGKKKMDPGSSPDDDMRGVSLRDIAPGPVRPVAAPDGEEGEAAVWPSASGWFWWMVPMLTPRSPEEATKLCSVAQETGLAVSPASKLPVIASRPMSKPAPRYMFIASARPNSRKAARRPTCWARSEKACSAAARLACWAAISRGSLRGAGGEAGEGRRQHRGRDLARLARDLARRRRPASPAGGGPSKRDICGRGGRDRRRSMVRKPKVKPWLPSAEMPPRTGAQQTMPRLAEAGRGAERRRRPRRGRRSGRGRGRARRSPRRTSRRAPSAALGARAAAAEKARSAASRASTFGPRALAARRPGRRGGRAERRGRRRTQADHAGMPLF